MKKEAQIVLLGLGVLVFDWTRTCRWNLCKALLHFIYSNMQWLLVMLPVSAVLHVVTEQRELSEVKTGELRS